MNVFKRKKRNSNHELSPDEIFLDSSNLPAFDKHRLEGRLERPLSRSTYAGLLLGICVVLGVYVIQGINLQIIHGEAYAAQSEQNRLRPKIIFAERGAILDRNGVILVRNEEAEGYMARVYASHGFGHLLGYVSYPKKDSKGNYYETEIEGLAGVERAYDESLRGENGLLLIEEDALGNIHSQGSVRAPRDGKDLMLSIDSRLQQVLFDTIKELADRIPYQGGAGVVMDTETGELYALVSYPEYDSNILSRGSPRDVIASYATDPRQPYVDRPVSGLYTPGSIVKPIIAAGAYTDGIISPFKEIISTGSISIPNPYDPENPTVFRDWRAHGATDMRHAIAVSSDVYFYTIGGGYGGQKGLGIERLAAWYRLFGFESPTGIELAGENSGFIPTPAWKEQTYNEPWRIGNTYHTAIGQYAMQITVLEAVRAIAAIANSGKLLQPTILSDASHKEESILVDQEALAVAREGMRLGVTEGTSVGLNAYSYAEAAGKTGTAELGVHNEYRNSWSVGFFPFSHPKYAWAIVMERGPAGNGVGGIYVMSKVFEALKREAPEYFE